MLEDDPQADDEDLDHERDVLNDAEEIDVADDLHNGARTLPDDDEARTRTPTTAFDGRETSEGSAADREPSASPDEGFGRHTMDIV